MGNFCSNRNSEDTDKWAIADKIKQAKQRDQPVTLSNKSSDTHSSPNQESADEIASPPVRPTKSFMQNLIHDIHEAYNDRKAYWKVGKAVDQLREFQKALSPFPELPPRQQAIEPFLRWCDEHRIDHKRATIGVVAGSGLGLLASDDIAAESPVVCVPYDAMLTSKIAGNELQNMIPKEIDRTWLQVPLALKLINDRLNPSKEWGPYVAMMPREYVHPITFDYKDFGILDGSTSYMDAIDMWAEIINQYAHIYLHMLNHPDRFEDTPINESTFTLDVYRWGMAVALTRSLKVKESSGEDNTALVPFWDMCNHGDETMSTSLDSANRCLGAYATRAHRQGEQLFICYRDSSTAEFFSIWGLVSPGYTYHPFRMSLNESLPNAAHCKEHLEKLRMGTSRDMTLRCTGATPIDKESMRFLMCIYADDDNDDKDGESGRNPSAATWRRAWLAFAYHAEKKLEGYAKKLADNQIALKQKQLRPGERLALELVVCEQSILTIVRDKAVLLADHPPMSPSSTMYSDPSRDSQELLVIVPAC